MEGPSAQEKRCLELEERRQELEQQRLELQERRLALDEEQKEILSMPEGPERAQRCWARTWTCWPLP